MSAILESGCGLLAADLSRHACVDQWQRHVVDGVHTRQKHESLEDEAQFAAQTRQLVRAETRDFDSVQGVTAAGRTIEAADQVHERGFARARRTHDGHELAAANFK